MEDNNSKPNLKIQWKSQDKLYGLDYSSKKGTYKHFVFDIRCDCDLKDPTINPECDYVLTIKYRGQYILGEQFGSLESLTTTSEGWLNRELKFLNNEK